MRALDLSTRFRDGAFEGLACLLVYDEIEVSPAVISSDMRDLLDSRPSTSWVYVLAPYVPEAVVVKAALNDQVIGRAGKQVWVLSYREFEGQKSQVIRIGRPDSELVEEVLSPELKHGWLFNLFDASKGKVTAPPGVHFGKASSKHATAFLRASNAILSTKASGLLAFFLMAALPKQNVRRILVDTAPLLSVAQALQQVATVHGFWSQRPPASSFSSYGGLDALSKLYSQDLVIISASTTGGLAARLLDLGASAPLVVTLFSLAEGLDGLDSRVICDLAYRSGRSFGYLPIENQMQGSCKWCDAGYLLAPLEGDQFLLEKRSVKRLRISKPNQTAEARKLLERWTRRSYFRLDPYGSVAPKSVAPKSLLVFDAERAIKEDKELRAKLVRDLRRYAPMPLQVVVLVGLKQSTYEDLMAEAGLEGVCADASVVDEGRVSGMSPLPEAGVLVLIGSLHDHALIRGINAQLRTKTPKGCVTYLAAFTFADSKQNLLDLEMFLTYGEHGKETFTFKSAETLPLPWRVAEKSSWEDELRLLLNMKGNGQLDPVLAARLEILESSSELSNLLFLQGKDGAALAIAPDFVYLDSTTQQASISQVDLFLVVSNLLAVARFGSLKNGLPETHHRWAQSVYGQVLVDLPTICPRNLRDYNDAVLRACFIRAASKQELNYAVDEECSGEVLDVVLAELDAWSDGKGDSLPELLMSLATRRLRLVAADEAKLIEKLEAANLPSHLQQLKDAWVAGVL